MSKQDKWAVTFMFIGTWMLIVWVALDLGSIVNRVVRLESAIETAVSR